MGNLNFLKYLNKFESEVVCTGLELDLLGKVMQVNIRAGRFSYSKYARYIGDQVKSKVPFVIDYYGYLKRSEGFIDLLKDKEEWILNKQVKSIETIVVFFASLKIEEIAEITNNQYLKSGFSEFKKEILYWRGFEKKKIKEEKNYRSKNRRVEVKR